MNYEIIEVTISIVSLALQVLFYRKWVDKNG